MSCSSLLHILTINMSTGLTRPYPKRPLVKAEYRKHRKDRITESQLIPDYVMLFFPARVHYCISPLTQGKMV